MASQYHGRQTAELADEIKYVKEQQPRKMCMTLFRALKPSTVSESQGNPCLVSETSNPCSLNFSPNHETLEICFASN